MIDTGKCLEPLHLLLLLLPPFRGRGGDMAIRCQKYSFSKSKTTVITKNISSILGPSVEPLCRRWLRWCWAVECSGYVLLLLLLLPLFQCVELVAWPFVVIGVVLNVNKIVKKLIVEQKKKTYLGLLLPLPLFQCIELVACSFVVIGVVLNVNEIVKIK